MVLRQFAFLSSQLLLRLRFEDPRGNHSAAHHSHEGFALVKRHNKALVCSVLFRFILFLLLKSFSVEGRVNVGGAQDMRPRRRRNLVFISSRSPESTALALDREPRSKTLFRKVGWLF